MKIDVAGKEIDYPLDVSVIDADLDRPFNTSPFISARNVCDLFTAEGIDCYIMGGAVRNWLVGRPARDIDITVSCPIDRALGIVSAYSDCIAIKPKTMFGLVYLLGDAGDIDVNSMRSCGDIQGNPDIDAVLFHPRSCLKTDAECRDFTINAFYLRYPEYGIVNFFPECMEDLERNVIRLIMDERKLKIDYRTTIRILQFMARGYHPTEHTLQVLRDKLDYDIVHYDRYRDWMDFHVPSGSADRDAFRALIFHYAADPAAVALLETWFQDEG